MSINRRTAVSQRERSEGYVEPGGVHHVTSVVVYINAHSAHDTPAHVPQQHSHPAPYLSTSSVLLYINKLDFGNATFRTNMTNGRAPTLSTTMATTARRVHSHSLAGVWRDVRNRCSYGGRPVERRIQPNRRLWPASLEKRSFDDFPHAREFTATGKVIHRIREA